MNYPKLVVAGVATFAIFWTGGAISATSGESTLSQAKQCSGLTERLERLACFDRVFNTPIPLMVQRHAPRDVPFAWHRAMDSYAATEADEIAHLNLQGVGNISNAWVTLAASNEKERFKEGLRPVLMMSCIDKISRFELALPKELSRGRVRVTLTPGDTRIWRSDDSGYILSAGRGMPAINQMKEIMRQKMIVLRADNKALDGLEFRTGSLSDDLKPIRKRCDW